MEINEDTILGRRRAEVVDIEHPEKLMKAKIRILGQWDNVPVEKLPWAEYALPVGARLNEGEFRPAKVGDYVWVEFDAGDTRSPIIIGSIFYAPNSVPNLPQESFAGEESFKGVERPTEPAFPSLIEPVYCHDYVFSKSGILIQLTETGTYRVAHKATGSCIEITNEGDIVIQAEKDLYQKVVGTKTDIITQHRTINIEGNYTINVKGNVKIEATGSADVISGATATLKGESVKIESGGAIDFKAGGAFNIDAGGAFAAKATNADWKLG